MAKKEELEERITPDEKERIEKKALEGQKVEKPIDEKLEEQVEKVVEEKIESLKGVEDIKEVEMEEKKKETEDETKVVTAQPVAAPPAVPTVVPSDKFPFWKPKTKLGKEVASGVITSVEQIIQSGRKILEPEILDILVPDIKSELILIGGRRGKGGGIKRIPVKITATMHRSGRKFTANAFAAVGDENGMIGIGKASALESRDAIHKAIGKAKANIIKIKRGCGSWECGCGEDHSIPYKTKGKCGSVRVVLIPAPRGLGLAADDESKKLLRLAGIKDVWMKTYGNTGTRINLITALFKALKNLYIYDR